MPREQINAWSYDLCSKWIEMSSYKTKKKQKDCERFHIETVTLVWDFMKNSILLQWESSIQCYLNKTFQL